MSKSPFPGPGIRTSLFQSGLAFTFAYVLAELVYDQCVDFELSREGKERLPSLENKITPSLWAAAPSPSPHQPYPTGNTMEGAP